MSQVWAVLLATVVQGQTINFEVCVENKKGCEPLRVGEIGLEVVTAAGKPRREKIKIKNGKARIDVNDNDVELRDVTVLPIIPGATVHEGQCFATRLRIKKPHPLIKIEVEQVPETRSYRGVLYSVEESDHVVHEITYWNERFEARPRLDHRGRIIDYEITQGPCVCCPNIEIPGDADAIPEPVPLVLSSVPSTPATPNPATSR